MSADCAYSMQAYTLLGRDRYSASCTTCGVPCMGWTQDQAHAAFVAHRDMPAPPADVLAAPLTVDIVAAYPAYFINGRGRQLAARTDCGHGYFLTDSCPCCP
jgi:hypothetical protein